MSLRPSNLLAQQAPGPDELYDIVLVEPQSSPLLLIIVLVLALLLIAGIAWFVWQYLDRRKTGESISPGKQAASKLREIESSREQLSGSRYVLALSEVLKDYLTARFSDPVRYETSNEFLFRISSSGSQLPVNVQNDIAKFLQNSEAIKFGNLSNTEAQAESVGKAVREIIVACESIPEESRKS